MNELTKTLQLIKDLSIKKSISMGDLEKFKAWYKTHYKSEPDFENGWDMDLFNAFKSGIETQKSRQDFLENYSELC